MILRRLGRAVFCRSVGNGICRSITYAVHNVPNNVAEEIDAGNYTQVNLPTSNLRLPENEAIPPEPNVNVPIRQRAGGRRTGRKEPLTFARVDGASRLARSTMRRVYLLTCIVVLSEKSVGSCKSQGL